MVNFNIKTLYFKIEVNIFDEFYEEELRKSVKREKSV